MVHLRFSSFILMLMFTLLEARGSIYNHHNHQGTFDIRMVPHILDSKTTKPIIVEENMFHDLEEKEEGGDKMLKGRKLGRNDNIEKEKARNGAKGSGSGSGSGANPSPWNYNHKGKGKLNVLLCKQSKAKMNGAAGFVALSADYHYPKPHPPRHN